MKLPSSIWLALLPLLPFVHATCNVTGINAAVTLPPRTAGHMLSPLCRHFQAWPTFERRRPTRLLCLRWRVDVPLIHRRLPTG